MLGTVRAADLLSVAMKNSPITLRSLIKEPLFVPDSMGIFKLLEALKASHRHLAIVLDEFGAVEGLVTVTDLLEAFVGSLPTDAAAERAIVARADGSWLVDGATPIDDVASELGLDDLPEGESGTYHTLGGFVMARLGRIPRTADVCEWGGMRFEVIDMDGRRIDKVLVSRLSAHRGATGATPATRTRLADVGRRIGRRCIRGWRRCPPSNTKTAVVEPTPRRLSRGAAGAPSVVAHGQPVDAVAAPGATSPFMRWALWRRPSRCARRTPRHARSRVG